MDFKTEYLGIFDEIWRVFTSVPPRYFPDGVTDGLCDPSDHSIMIRDATHDADTDPFAGADPVAAAETTARHELIHAMFYSAGMDKYAGDETLVSFLTATWWRISSYIKQIESHARESAEMALYGTKNN